MLLFLLIVLPAWFEEWTKFCHYFVLATVTEDIFQQIMPLYLYQMKNNAYHHTLIQIIPQTQSR